MRVSKYLRVFSVEVDEFGIDPIRDKLVPEIAKIKSYTVHEVTQDERGAPDLISLREYGTDEFWWMILAYNGIGSFKKIVEGTRIRIPSQTALIALVTANAVRPSVVQRVITI